MRKTEKVENQKKLKLSESKAVSSIIYFLIFFTSMSTFEIVKAGDLAESYRKIGWSEEEIKVMLQEDKLENEKAVAKKKAKARQVRLEGQRALMGQIGQAEKIDLLPGDYEYENYVNTVDLKFDADRAVQRSHDPYEKPNMKRQRFNNGYRETILSTSDLFNESEKSKWIGNRSSNLSNHLGDIFVNLPMSTLGLFIGEIEDFTGTIGRIVINSGSLGMWDLANKLGTTHKNLNFLQRKDRGVDAFLKKLGLPCGNFQIIPFVGPSTTRGTTSAVIREMIYATLSGPTSTIVTIVRIAGEVNDTFSDIEDSKFLYGGRDVNFRPAETDKYKEKQAQCKKENLTDKECGLDEFSLDERIIYLVIRENELKENECYNDTDVEKMMEKLYRADPEKYFIAEEDREDLDFLIEGI